MTAEIGDMMGLLDRAAERHRGGGALARVGLSREQILSALERSRPLTPEEVRRAAARALRKQSVGRAGLPAHAVDAMHADYLRLKSLAKVGALYGRTRQSIYQIFRAHGKPMNAKLYFPRVIHNGRAYTPGKDGYLRATSGDRRPLHYVIWEEANGPVPPDRCLTFRDGNNRRVALGNLVCCTLAEATRMHATGHNQSTPRALLKRKRRLKPSLPTP